MWLGLVTVAAVSATVRAAEIEPTSFGPINIPLAPYNVKLYCRNGKIENYTDIPKLRPSKCPTASTSCGYFELRQQGGLRPTGIFDCVDSSVFVSEQDEEIGGGMNFNRLCSHKPMCHLIPTIHFNKQFLRYMMDNHHLQHIPSAIKFCCYLNHVLLTKLIVSGQRTLPSVNTTPVYCEKKKCEEGAIGCLKHTKTVRIDQHNHIYDYFDVKPVEIVWEEESSDDDNYETLPLITSELPKETNYCVYPHLNNELYRYCLMIYNEKLDDNCYIHNGHAVCCCFVGPDDTTCKLKDISLPEPSSTSAPATTIIIPTTPLKTSTTTTSTTTSSMPTITDLPTTLRPMIRNSTRRRPQLSPSYRKPRCRKKYIHESRFKSKSDRSQVKVVWKCNQDPAADKSTSNANGISLTGVCFFTFYIIFIHYKV
ncbi:unnamed protein product [Bursaphelenchus xylophilus]|uniref:(pine wood nematode) hypothetical protein n=1 Tax=Bursaphelenchus xylophilus TaxID=6326 RepID=A0A1I7RPQ2_BURXY|nr:unnamed protein product [Bursaphelenchus xylophilus]CAG9096430.1 unnamed protein product [Bursaphelenchus xylophilus]